MIGGGTAWFAGDVYVGSTSGTGRDEGSQKLVTQKELDSKISKPEEDGTDGQVLATDGKGNLYWTTVNGEDIDTTTKTLTPVSVQEGYYYDRNGVLTENVYAAAINVATYDVSRFNKLHVYSKGASLIASYWEDADGTLTMAFAGDSGSNYLVDKDIDIPTEAVSLHNSYLASVTPVFTNLSKATGSVEVDQTYDPESENAQSGVAVAQAIAASLPQAVTVELEPVSTQDGAFLNSSGVVDTTTDGHTVCQIIRYPVTGGSTIHVACTSASLCYSFWVDSNGTRTLAFGGSSYINVDMDVDVPDNATYFDLTCRNDKGSPSVTQESGDVYSIVVAMQNELKGQFRGKKIGIIGDSIAVGEKLNSGDKNFISVFAESVGASGVKNAAIGGWDYCDALSHGVYRQINGLAGTTTALDGDEDLIIIFAGTNDFGHASPLGEPWTLTQHSEGNEIKTATTDTFATTFCGGVHKTVETLYEKYGYIPIVMCTPLHRNYPSSTTGYPDTSHWANTEGLFIDDYVEAIEKVAGFYGIPVFNSYRLTGLYPINSAQNTKYFADGIHPNAAGHKVIGEGLAKFIKSLFLPEK